MLNLVDSSKAKDRLITMKVFKDWLEAPLKTYNRNKRGWQPHARWLVVFDNVDQVEILEDFWPGRGGGGILMTSRDPLSAWSPYGGETLRPNGVEVRPLDLMEATDLLKRAAPGAETIAQPNGARDLAERLDCIPLALRQMGGYIRQRNISFARFLRMYQNEASHHAIHRSKVRMANFRYDYNLSTVFALESMPASTLSLMNVLSLLDPDHIKDSVLIATNKLPSGYPLSEDEYLDARQTLWASSLISVYQEDEEISLHRTVQDAARARMDVSQLHVAFETAALLLLESWPVKGRMWHYPLDHWEACEVLSPHIVKIYDHYVSNSDMHKQSPPSTDFAKLLAYVGWYYHERGDPYQAKSFFDTAEELCEHDPSRNEELLTELWKCQGCIATETNDGTACVDHYTKLLAKTQELIPEPKGVEEFNDLGLAYNEMGIAHMMIGDIDSGFDLFEVARSYSERYRKVSDTATSIFLLASANLGLAHWLRDRWEDSLAILLQAFQVHETESTLGEKDSFVPGRLMHAIGNVKTSQGLVDGQDHIYEGFKWHCRAFDHYKASIGEDHHRTADVSHRLAEHFMRMKQYTEAEDHIDIALKVFNGKRCYHPEKMRTMHLQGLLSQAKGDIVGGQRLIDEAGRMYKSYSRERKQDVPSRKLAQQDFDAAVTFWSR
ncbi:hypothetical protein LTR85_003223 [Meristemomyces frigidus]|nr:hypothetical protein LTR85_003223 [Meristemomyces frigidus]